jgi:undecaprenyl-diphosphatase
MFLILEILFLAVVQGITEFLPISSSGHLVILSSLFDQVGVQIEEKLTVGIILHMGTLLAILCFYRHRIIALLKEDRRVVGLILVGSIPAAAVGFTLKKYATGVLESPLVAGCMLLMTGFLLIWGARYQEGKTECRELSYRRAFYIGLFQAFAILPGISRSGSTISAGLAAGLKRSEAATFSFLLAIPAIGGAGLLEIKDLVEASAEGAANGVPIYALAAGGLASFVIGWISLAWLVKWLEKGRLAWFAWWVFTVAPIVIVWQLCCR